jgi:hypothetical protein
MRWLTCTVFVWSQSINVAQAMPGICGTPEFLDMTLASVQMAVPPLPPGPTKGTREAHGACAGSATSENFTFKWGADAPPSPDEIEQILVALERAWDTELNEMEHAHPYGSDSHLFNVYFGDSGDCAPSAYGMGGYYTTDTEGWPMIVLSNGVFDDRDYGQTTVAHEFYHAVQHAEGSFANNEEARWWWEATAMWVESVVYPSTKDYYTFLHGYAFQPHRQLNSYTYPENGVLEEFHQYGAGIWPKYLTEFESDWTLVRDSWATSGPDDDPVEVIRVLMGSDLDEVFADFAAHNAVWDYFHGNEMEAWLDYMVDVSGFGSQDARIVDTVASGGTSTEWQTPPQDTLPERYGYNVIRMSSPNDGTMVVRFQGELMGSQGSESKWLIRVVREKDHGIEYEELVVIDGEGQLTLRDVGTELAIYLVVTVSSPAWRSDEVFAYTYQMDMGVGSQSSGSSSTPMSWGSSFDDSESEKGCACSSTSFSLRSVWWWLPLIGLICRRRD